MTPPPDDQLQDTLRTAFRQTAQDIPAVPPPLRLNPGRKPAPKPARRRRWMTWLTPLAAAAVVVAVVAASLALAHGVHRAPPSSRPAVQVSTDPRYSVTLLTNGKPAEFAVQAQIRSTATGAVIATIAPPAPYVMFTGVTAAADGQAFVLSAEVKTNGNFFTQARFFVLHVPLHPGPGDVTGVTFRALPASFIPASTSIEDMALAPDGRSLAADLETATGSRLAVFDLATGTSRTWSSQFCDAHQCGFFSGGLGFGNVNVDGLSWTGDGKKILFFWRGQIRLLDTAKTGTNLLANSKLIVSPPNAPAGAFNWRGAFITPDGRTVVAVEELIPQQPDPASQRLVTFSVATGRLTATLNRTDVIGDYEQVLWSNASGSRLVVAYAHGGDSLDYLEPGGRYLPLPWPSQAVAAAW